MSAERPSDLVIKSTSAPEHSTSRLHISELPLLVAHIKAVSLNILDSKFTSASYALARTSTHSNLPVDAAKCKGTMPVDVSLFTSHFFFALTKISKMVVRPKRTASVKAVSPVRNSKFTFTLASTRVWTTDTLSF